jgi:hypothetical protein
VPALKTNLPTSEMTVGLPFSKGATCMCEVSRETPKNITASNEAMTTRVVLAFFHSGGRKTLTPFEMASTPVTAAPPEAKAWATT